MESSLGRRSAAILALALLLGPLPVARDAAASDVSGPAVLQVDVSAPRLDAVVTWAHATQEASVATYQVEVRGASEPVVANIGHEATSLVVSGLPVAELQWAVVKALDSEGHVIAEGRSGQFEVLPSLSIDNPAPFVKHGDGPCCESEWVYKTLRLDTPMPTDVWVRPFVLDFDGNTAHDGFEATDWGFPGMIWQDAIRIPAGDVTARFQIIWWGDEWKRFEYAHTTWGFEIFDHPRGGSGWVHLDQAVQEVTFYEDDPYFWPEVHVAPQTLVKGGQTARVRVALDARPAKRTVLRYNFRNGSARAGRDYRRSSGRLVFKPGQRVGWVRVPTSKLGGPAGRTFSVRVTKAEEKMAEVRGRQESTVRIHQ